MDVNHVASTYMGVGKGGREILKIFSKKGCFLSFEWEKANFATFDLP